MTYHGQDGEALEHWGTAVPAEGWHWLALGHWSASRLALARTGHPVPAPVEALGTAVLL